MPANGDARNSDAFDPVEGQGDEDEFFGLPQSPFPPIADYAFLSDCETGALIASNGNVEWMCMPRPDSPSVFASMLDRKAGSFRLGPDGVRVPAGRRYLPGTLVLETTWQTASGWILVTDALAVGDWRYRERRATWHPRPPTDHQAERVLVRTVECISGTVDIEMECEPAFDYGRRHASWEFDGPAYNAATVSEAGSQLRLRLRSDLFLGIEGAQVKCSASLKEGEGCFAALSWSDEPGPDSLAEAIGLREETAEFWREWLKRGDFPDHRWRATLQRSALTLKGLTYAPTGAILAAASTSLPETPGGVRNWDYRYCWIRDSAFILWSLYTIGFEREADDFFNFIADVSEKDQVLQVVYGVGEEQEIKERKIDGLSGYEGARPVRVGNAAYQQRQHDVWGAAIDAMWLHYKKSDHLPARLWPILKRHVQSAVEAWPDPDQGIWEVRSESQHFTSSKLMCWVATDRGSRLAQIQGEHELADKWQGIAQEIKRDICANGMDPRGAVFVQHYGATALDASLLLMPLVRFLPSDDERIRNTVLAIEQELTEGGMVLRYRVDRTDDGLAGEEGTFTICSFWLVSALAEIGEFRRARELCEKLLSYASPLGLYAEELDVKNGRHLGNFPQAFTHLALVNALMHVIRSETGVDPRRFSLQRSFTA